MFYKKPYVSYNAGNTQFARSMRKSPTPSEKIMRDQILKKRPLGTKWWRQKPLGPYIADFYCPALQMIIEIDG
jgi:very-short-patch-repair endonuclease